MKTVKVYLNYGTLSNESRVVATEKPLREALMYDTVYCKLPKGYEVYDTYLGNKVLINKEQGLSMFFSDALRCTRNGKRIYLKIVDLIEMEIEKIFLTKIGE